MAEEVSFTSALVAVEPVMEDHFVRSTRLQLMMGIEAYQKLLEHHHFVEVELTERGREMFRNGEWNWGTLCVFLRSKIG